MGDTIGALVVTGNYSQGAIATLSVKINGPSANEIDQLTVLGTATLNGILEATLMNGFTPNQGETLPILNLVHPAIGNFATFFSPSNNGVMNLQPFNSPGGLMVEDLPAGQSVSVTYREPEWQSEGPDPISSAQSAAAPDNGDVGAIADVVVAPDGTVYVGTVNGGVWRSDLVTTFVLESLEIGQSVNPTNFWVPLTDSQPSLAVSTMALDPNAPNNTLWVGTGSLSSYGGGGGPAVGLLKTTDRGQTWVDLSGTLRTTITAVSSNGPIVITTNTSTLVNGSQVTISGVNGNMAANGTWTVANVTATSFTIEDESGNPVLGNGKFTSSPKAAWASSIFGDTILSVVPTGNTDPTTGKEVILVATNANGIWRSVDGGARTSCRSISRSAIPSTRTPSVPSSPTRPTRTTSMSRSTAWASLKATTTGPTGLKSITAFLKSKGTFTRWPRPPAPMAIPFCTLRSPSRPPHSRARTPSLGASNTRACSWPRSAPWPSGRSRGVPSM